MTLVQEAGVDRRLERLEERIEFLVAEAEERQRFREAVSDLTGDLSPVARQGFNSVTRALAEAEERGYMGFTRSGISVLDRIVTSFSEEDIEALGDNVVLILETVKEMTQPEVMQMMRSTLHGVHDAEEPTDPPSLLALMRRMRTPEARRGLFRLVVLLESLGGVTDTRETSDRKEAVL